MKSWSEEYRAYKIILVVSYLVLALNLYSINLFVNVYLRWPQCDLGLANAVAT